MMTKSRVASLLLYVGIGLAIVCIILGYSFFPSWPTISRNWIALIAETVIVFSNFVGYVRATPTTRREWYFLTLAFVAHITIGILVCAYVMNIPLVWFFIATVVEISVLLRGVNMLADRAI